jgi:two-component sensor histidine kinase
LRRRLKRLEDVASRHAAMLREGDHRIKNSLQIVSSMMGLQARNETNPAARVALQAAAARVQSVGRIHDALQSGAGGGMVDLAMVLATMCASLDQMAGDPNRISVIVHIGDQPVRMPAEIAQPIILAVTELVSNALRHAFPGDRTGAVHVILERTANACSVVVADDGVGLPPDYGQGRGFGMSLVRIMTMQVRGEFHIDRSSGTKLAMVVPLA